VDRLAYSSTYIVGIGMTGKAPDHLKTKCWMYFPENNSPYYRVTVFSNYSPNNVAVPGEQWSLMAEISESRFKKVDEGSVVGETIRAMEEDSLLPDRGTVVSTVVRRVGKSYPVPFLDRDELVDPILRRFERMGIFSRGRFGSWKYEVGNQDHSFQQGYECVDRIVNNGGAEYEPTLHTPNLVNSRRNS
jgi:protoporphyrinogen oxidase